jgi:molybdopterin/thiamine biosynthesis adenylyltransferase
MLDDIALSRPMAAAARLADSAVDCHRFVEKRVLLTGEPAVLETANGRECLLSSLRLLVRICPNIAVALPRGDTKLVDECRELADRIAFGKRVEFLVAIDDWTSYDAILSVGTQARGDLPWTVVNSNGWLARVSSGSTDLPRIDDELINPIGSLAAACLGVCDVFKRLIQLKPGRGRLFDGLAFSLYSYRCGEADAGPALLRDLPVDLLLIGGGAIGNGVVHLLGQLPLRGRTDLVDKQEFGKENLGTCLLIGPDDMGTSKAEFGARLLRQRHPAIGYHETLNVFQNRLGKQVRYPGVVLNAVDNIDARHEAQALWPDVLIDGAIGDFPCQVSRYDWGLDRACMKCLFQHPPGAKAEVVASCATGLSEARVEQAEETVTEDDVRKAPENLQEWLHRQLGRQICSVVRDGIARQISTSEQRIGFSPSVPFVACLSACMMVGELVKHISGWSTELETRFQFDSLRGPAFGAMVPQRRRQDCECAARATNIEKWRRLRVENAHPERKGSIVGTAAIS